MDAITLLKDDHKTVEKLFKQFESAGDDAHKAKRDIVDRIIEELSKHAAIEEQLFYPVTRATVDDIDDVVLESLEEHHIVKWVLSELDGMAPTDERFVAKVTVLIENVRHHVEEEEEEYFPKVRDELGRNALNELGDAMQALKASAPTHPHPRLPDSPPGNLVGAAAGMADRIGDTAAGLAGGAVAAVQDVIARVRGVKSPAAPMGGSRVTRRTAANARSRVNEAVDSIEEAVDSARREGKRTVERAGRTAKRTSSAAKRTSRSTAQKASSSAKKATRTTAKKASGTARKASASAKRASGTAKKATRTTAKKATRTAAKKSSGSAKRASTTAKRATGAAKKASSGRARQASGSATRASASAKRVARSTAKRASGTAKRTSRTAA
ncbi:MAG: hypothetical protein JWM05_94 [Acidimicrobiales bacterium]|nr:hypothetical protein [Acidimicrobiales bacterium]